VGTICAGGLVLFYGTEGLRWLLPSIRKSRELEEREDLVEKA